MSRLALDPLEGAALQRELPGIQAAFNPLAMQEHLENALFDCRRQRHTVVGCHLAQAAYVPGECCILRYRLQLQERETGEQLTWLVTGRLFGSEPACRAYVSERLVPLLSSLAGREPPLPFGHPVGVAAPLLMAVHAFPLDGELPALLAATDARRMSDVLRATLPAALRRPAGEEAWRIEVVNYRHRHRATLRYLPEEKGGAAAAPERAIYGKLSADPSGAAAGRITAALRDQLLHRGYPFHIPDVFGWVADLRLSLLGAIPGKPGLEHAIKGRLRGRLEHADQSSLEEMVEAGARICAAIHDLDLSPGPVRTLDEDLQSLSREIAGLRRISPDLGGQLDCRWRRLVACSQGPSLPKGLCHGDFTIGQLLVDGREIGLVDFDSFCQAEPALDLAQFLAYLRVATMNPSVPQSAPIAEALGERFLETYVAARGGRVDRGRLRERVGVYAGVSLLRRTVRSWQKFKPGRVETALAALDEGMGRYS